MGRRVPGVRALMEQAAVELYAERGTTQEPTATEISARAGVTERTFYRHFPDKLEAFFGDEVRLHADLAAAVAAAPAGSSALGAALAGLRAQAREFAERRAAIVTRARIVARHPKLRDRELGRAGHWSEVIAGALRERGVDDVSARCAALVALAIFRAAYEEWTDDDGRSSLPELLDATADRVGRELGELRE